MGSNIKPFSPTFWNDIRTNKLIELWEDGRSVAEIKFILRASSYKAVKSKAYRMKLKRPKAMIKVERIKRVATRKLNKPAQFIDKKGVSYGTPKPLENLSSQDCRFPIGDPKNENFIFCGAKIELGESYCPNHHQLCYKGNK